MSPTSWLADLGVPFLAGPIPPKEGIASPFPFFDNQCMAIASSLWFRLVAHRAQWNSHLTVLSVKMGLYFSDKAMGLGDSADSLSCG